MKSNMKIGLLWFDDSRRPIGEKIGQAAERYRQKFGRWPNCVFVNPGTLGNFRSPNGLQVVAADNILPNHFWIGVAEQAG